MCNTIRETFKNLSDAQLLSRFIGTDLFAEETAANAIQLSGGIRQIITGTAEEAVPYGLGKQEHYALNLALEIASRHLKQQLKREDALTNPGLVKQYFQSKLRDLDYEVFAVLLLDNQRRTIKFIELFRGTIDGAAVYPREVAKLCLEYSAAACILVHNHPSGIAEPSGADKQITKRLKDALELIDVRVLDHIIVGDSYCESFAERGLI